MASKRKLTKNELTVGSKVIKAEAFAYDMFVYSATKFGVPEECLSRWEGVTNDYGHENFIEVISRVPFGVQIKLRHKWYKLFKGGNESNEFKSFDGIKSALQEILRDRVGDLLDRNFYNAFFIALAVINELILFLYSENYGLYLKELAKFWWKFFQRHKKLIEKDALLENAYKSNTNPEGEALEALFNQFIPAHGIPYSEMNLNDKFSKEYYKVFRMPEENLEQRVRQFEAEVSRRANLIRTLEFQAQTDVDTPERVKASAKDKNINPGLGIKPHEAVLKYAREVDAATPHQNLPSTSQETERERRGSASQKGKQKKETGSCSSMEGLERLNIGVLGVDSTTSSQNLPGGSQETERERRGSASQKGKQKKKTGSCSITEDLERLNIGQLGVDAATSHQNLPTTSRQETVKNRSETSSQKEEQMKVASRSSDGGFGGLHLGFAKASGAPSLQNLHSTSRQETVSNPIETSSQKEEQKQAISRSNDEVLGQLNMGYSEDCGATSLQNLPSTTEKKKSKKKRKKSSSCSNEEQLKLSSSEKSSGEKKE